jgi:ATP-dependent Clp protease adaptor protein ClpS
MKRILNGGGFPVDEHDPAPVTRELPAVATQTRPRPSEATKPDQPWLWNVVLLDDDEHTYEYVIRMMQDVFGVAAERALRIAQTVDLEGRAVCLTTHREHAELKIEQIHGFGPDRHMAISKGPMSAIIEPAEFGGDEDDDHA